MATSPIRPSRVLLSARPGLPSPVHPPGLSTSVSRSVTSFIRLSAERSQQRVGRWDELGQRVERSRSWHDCATRSGAREHVARIRAMAPRFDDANRSEAQWVSSTIVEYPPLRRSTDGGLLDPGLFRNVVKWPHRLRNYRRGGGADGAVGDDGALRRSGEHSPLRAAVPLPKSETRITRVHIDRRGALSLHVEESLQEIRLGGRPAPPRQGVTLAASLALLAKKKKTLRHLERAARRAARDRPWRMGT